MAFTKDAMKVPRAIRSRIELIEKRHEGIKKIEEGAKELQELFTDLSVLVNLQQETLDNISQNVMETKDSTKKRAKRDLEND
eukprot:TRINITY_DN2198_c0_g2_i1.p1 TRINITY_DN2198_c0_g2~~TRINITY_DN2198_c0_g2_i1.p1  ORF type:complete len:82 (-),score=18.96 TRINITY_DN2198_c0_g2_i1:190-435(-)